MVRAVDPGQFGLRYYVLLQRGSDHLDVLFYGTGQVDIGNHDCLLPALVAFDNFDVGFRHPKSLKKVR